MTPPADGLETAIPDLRDLTPDQVAAAGPVLADAIARYRERLRESGVTLSSFQARI